MEREVTALRIDPKRKRRIQVYLDGALAMTVAAGVADGLAVGDRLDEPALVDLLQRQDEAEALAQALRLTQPPAALREGAAPGLGRLDRDITPALENLTRVSRAAAEISDLATLQARRLDLLLADTIEKIEETTGVIQQFVVRPLKPVGGILAFLKGLQRGMEVYLQLGGSAGHGLAPGTPPIPRRCSHSHEDDEHLFI